ncbi:MAG: hypothetical protein AAF658_08650 [Myxococcota bacterium]
MTAAKLVLWLFYGYLAIGALVGPAFVFVFANRWVGGAKESGILFRFFVLPASIVLWPLVLVSIGRLRREAVS